MSHTFAFVVVALDHALVWNKGLEPGAKPLRLEAEPENPQYRKERDGHEGDRTRSHLDLPMAAEIAKELASAAHIYLLSAGSGKSDGAHQFLEYLKSKHPELAERVLATGSADINRLTDNQLLELGRDRRAQFLKVS